jgi:hypothetical protein
MAKIIWTNHALERLTDRKIPQSQVYQTISSPDSKTNSSDGSVELSKQYGHQKVHAIVKENAQGELIVLSCWINPPNYGSEDFKKEKFSKENKKASGFKKFWLVFKNQMGL